MFFLSNKVLLKIEEKPHLYKEVCAKSSPKELHEWEITCKKSIKSTTLCIILQSRMTITYPKFHSAATNGPIRRIKYNPAC